MVAYRESVGQENGQTTLLEQLVCTGSRASTTAAMDNNNPERLETLATPIVPPNHHTTTRHPIPTRQPDSNNDNQSESTKPDPIGPIESLQAAQTGETLFFHLEHSETGETTLTATISRINPERDRITLDDAETPGQQFTLIFEGNTAKLHQTRRPHTPASKQETSDITTPSTLVGTVVAVHNLASYSR